jgi:hypothetical protein
MSSKVFGAESEIDMNRIFRHLTLLAIFVAVITGALAAPLLAAPLHWNRLTWADSNTIGTTNGAVSFSVYRGTVSGGPYIILATGLLSLSYNDANIVSATPYFYVVTATCNNPGNVTGACTNGQESAFSNEFSVTSATWTGPNIASAAPVISTPASGAVIGN